jgi:hypothetical protein
MQFDRQRVQANVKAASTEDLLDRVTIFREGMEADALPIIEDELRARGIGNDVIRFHEEQRRRAGTLDSGGFAAKCSLCSRPAVVRVRHWHLLWQLVPIFPRSNYFCEEHRPDPIDES